MQPRFLDPTLSERPRLDARTEVAARRSDQLLSISPRSADRRLVSTDQLRLPSPTNKAVNPIRRSSAGVQGHMNHNDRGTISQIIPLASIRFFSFLKINFRLFAKTSCHLSQTVRRHDGRDCHVCHRLWITITVEFHDHIYFCREEIPCFLSKEL